MTHAPEEVARIAAGLTKAQREMILVLSCAWFETQELLKAIEWRHGGSALRGFGQSGLIEGIYREPMKHRLTPLGLAVRAHLEQTNTSEGEA